MPDSEKQDDVYEQRLDAVLEKLTACQKENKVASCSTCEKYLECDIRSAYVGAVYDSMSKGQTGGFEF